MTTVTSVFVDDTKRKVLCTCPERVKKRAGVVGPTPSLFGRVSVLCTDCSAGTRRDRRKPASCLGLALCCLQVFRKH